jgi:exoribonuclease R
VFDGQVLSLTRRGMFVLFDRLFQGYLSVSELPRDEYRLNELETALEGKRTSRSYKLADRLQIRVTAVDAVRGRVDLTLASGSGRNEDERAGARPRTSGSGRAPRRGRR